MAEAARFDAVVVGAGLAGATMAERLASAGRSVLVVDRREHLAGNAFDHADAHGVVIHRYGPHIFHTNSDLVAAYLSRFTAWRPYRHRVLARVSWRGRQELVPIPINRTTINRLYGTDLDPAGVAALLDRLREPRSPLATSEDVVVDAVGRELYEAFFRGYTRKQWGRDPSGLDAAVTARIPTRCDDDDRYFTDSFQAMPAEGYAALVARMLDHPNIRVELSRDLSAAAAHALAPLVVWTGPLDAYFGSDLGALPWRSLRFEHEHRPLVRAQAAPVVNECDAVVPFTRTSELTQITGQAHAGTTLTREFPQDHGDPYYPVPAPEAKALADRYRARAASEPATIFVGRLAQYRYFNMDQVVAAALTQAEKCTAQSPSFPPADDPTAERLHRDGAGG